MKNTLESGNLFCKGVSFEGSWGITAPKEEEKKKNRKKKRKKRKKRKKEGNDE